MFGEIVITKNNILVHEFIGLEVIVKKSSDRKMVGMRGRVVDETKNTLLIETKKGEKRIPKVSSVFLFILPSGEMVCVDGKLIACRPEDRPKKLMKYCRM